MPLNFARQRFEADFRFSLVRFRENAESVALYGGEPVELGIFHERFRSLFENFRQILSYFSKNTQAVQLRSPPPAALPSSWAEPASI